MDLNNYNKIESRTRQLLRIFINDWEDENKDSQDYNWNNILNHEVVDYDCFRLYNFFTHLHQDKSISQEIDYIAEFQKDVLKESKIFSLKPSLKHLLRLTKPEKIKEDLKLPFNQLFLDTDIIFEEHRMRIFGILVNLIKTEDLEGLRTSIENNTSNLDKNIEKYVFETTDRLLQYNLVNISVLFYAEEKKTFSFVDMLYDLSSGKLVKKGKIKGIKKDKYQFLLEHEITSLVTNLLLFLNEPRVSIYIQETNNKRREKKGLIPIPSILRTKIEIGLEEYIEKIYFNGLSHSKLGFSFWVRGHWRRFLSPRFVNKQGQKCWIAPHISGEGLMPPQIFEVKCSKDKQLKETDKGVEQPNV